MISSTGNLKRHREQVVELPRMKCKYLIKEYTYHRTICKLVYVNGKLDTTRKIEEYIYWESALKPKANS